MVQAQVGCRFAQACPTGCEESAEQAAGLQFLKPGLPALCGGAEASRIPASSAEIAALPSRKSRPV